MTNEAKADYVDLVDAWWKTAELFEVTPTTVEAVRTSWHAHVFERILIQCGWSVQEWNDTIASELNKTQKATQ